MKERRKKTIGRTWSRRAFLSAAGVAALAPAPLVRAQPRPAVRLQAFAGGSTAMALKAMEEGGFDKKHGFEGKMFYFNPNISYQQFIQRNTDVSIDTDPLVVAKARLEGHKMVCFFSCTNNHCTILVKKDAPYRSLPDLRGKRLGHYGIDSGGFSSFALVARIKHGMDAMKDFQLREAAPPALLPLLGKGDLDAIISFEPLMSRAAVTIGSRVLFGPFAHVWREVSGQPLLLTAMAAFEDYIRDRLDVCRRVRDAWIDTARWITANPDIVERDSFKKLTGVSEPEAIALLKRAIVDVPMYNDSWDGVREATEKAIQQAADLKVVITRNPGGSTVRLDG